MDKGLEAKSLGLVKMARTNSDSKFTAVEHIGNTIWALHPKYFNKSDVSYLSNKWNPNVSIDTSVYVGTVNIKGQLTHDHFEMTKYDDIDIVTTNNPVSGMDPSAYASSLGSGWDSYGDPDAYAPMFLSYGLTANSKTINVLDLPGIDVNSNANITVSHPEGSISVPLPSIVNGDFSGNVIVDIVENTLTGFLYDFRFGPSSANRCLYDKNIQLAKVMSNYQTHMIQNKNREEAIATSDTFNSVISVIKGLSGGEGLDVVGGASAALDALFKYGLKEAEFSDMRRQASNIGGDYVNLGIGRVIDNLITIDYPVSKRILISKGSSAKSTITPSDYAMNESKSYEVNGVFPDMNTAMSQIETMYKGTLLGGDIKPVVDYGEYSKYFTQIIERGGLL